MWDVVHVHRRVSRRSRQRLDLTSVTHRRDDGVRRYTAADRADGPRCFFRHADSADTPLGCCNRQRRRERLQHLPRRHVARYHDNADLSDLGTDVWTSSTFTVESRDAAGNVSTSRASLTVATTACSPTPTGTGLQWAPPALANPTTIDVTNQNRESYLDNNNDYIVKLPSTPLTAEGGLC